jgi:hypothetical protein
MDIEKHLFTLLAEAIDKRIPADVKDIYALSFYAFPLDEDPRQMRLEMSHNTESQAQAAVSLVRDPREGRWNYAYWLQEPTAIFGRGSKQERRDIAVRDAWMRQADLFYTDVEEIEYPDMIEPKIERLPAAFHEMLARVAQRLHGDSVLDKRWGKALPIIIHNGDFDENTLRLTRSGNPPEILTDFEEWMSAHIEG